MSLVRYNRTGRYSGVDADAILAPQVEALIWKWELRNPYIASDRKACWAEGILYVD